jgi:hypothetical protein
VTVGAGVRVGAAVGVRGRGVGNAQPATSSPSSPISTHSIILTTSPPSPTSPTVTRSVPASGNTSDFSRRRGLHGDVLSPLALLRMHLSKDGSDRAELNTCGAARDALGLYPHPLPIREMIHMFSPNHYLRCVLRDGAEPSQ